MKTSIALKPTLVSTTASLLFAASLISLSGLAAETEGPAEKAGQQIDLKAEQAGQKMGDIKESASDKASSAGEYMDDSAITAKIKLAILRDPALKVFQISVTTTEGVVKLTGAVDSQQSIDRATEVARGTANVKSVENNLTIKGTS